MNLCSSLRLASYGLLFALVHVVGAQIAFRADFEDGTLSGLSLQGGQATVRSEAARFGQYGVRLQNGNLRSNWITLQPGSRYKAQTWFRLSSETGQDWGGMRVSVINDEWQTIVESGPLEISGYGTQWFKVSLPFTAARERVAIEVGYFGGPGRAVLADADDVVIRGVEGPNQPPLITAVRLTPATVNAPTTQQFEVDADDPDGTIDQAVWEFGDGTRAFGLSGSRHVGIAGSFTGRVILVDEEGASTSATFTWSSTRTGGPVLVLTAPPDGTVTSDGSVLLSGSLSGASRLAISTDRGYWRELAAPITWPIAVPLRPGWNRLLVQAHGSGGQIATIERRVRRVMTQPPAIEFAPPVPTSVERWDPIEILFHVHNSSATHPQFPFEPYASGLEWVDGITVDAVFEHEGTPDRQWRRPAFLWQRYAREFHEGEEWMYPVGEPVWCVRFAPPLTGTWRYRILVREAAGEALSEWRAFEVRSPTHSLNRGPVRVSPRDPRYFEYADGGYFAGVGHGIGFSPERFTYDADQLFQQMGNSNQNFFRWWIAGQIWGSAWQPWTVALPYEGTVPATGLALESAYGNGLATWRLDDRNWILWQGFMSGHAGLISGRTYRIRVRWRTEGISGPRIPGQPHGLCVKFVGWPERDQTLSIPPLIGPVTLDTPWHVASAEFTATTRLLPNLAVILENTTAGRAYVDELAVEEKLGPEVYGPNLLRSPAANSHLRFDARRGAGIEHILQQAQQHAMTLRLNIGEKQEFLLNHLSPQGLPYPRGDTYFDTRPGPVLQLHRWHWRHLFARFGVFRSVHSWELCNEVAPGPGGPFALTAELERAAAADGNPHPASISTWASLAETAWDSPEGRAISHVDFHCYVHATGWIEPRSQLLDDTARFFHEYDLDARRAFPDRPIVWGEAGLDNASGEEDPELVQDAQGIWLHKFLWARTGPGGVYPLYWYTDNIYGRSLHDVFGRWRRFIEPIPLTNGRYRDAEATASHPQLRVLGQKDLIAGRAHLWIDNRGHTWRAVVRGAAITPISGTVSLLMDRADALYDCEWFDPYSGQPTQTQTLQSGTDGRLTLPITALSRDRAVRIERRLTLGERWRLEHFETTENAGPAADSADPDGDGRVNLEERAFQTNPKQPDRPDMELRLDGNPPRLTLDYRRVAPPRDATFCHSGADDLRGPWSQEGIMEHVLRVIGGEEWVRVQDAFTMEEKPRRFLRVEVLPEPSP